MKTSIAVQPDTSQAQAHAARALELSNELDGSPLLSDPDALFAWLNERDPTIARWVDARTRRLREGQHSRLGEARQERERAQHELQSLAETLKSSKTQLADYRQRVAELEKEQGNPDDEARRLLDDLYRHPAVLDVKLNDGSLYVYLRFLLEKQGVVYDFGDWRIFLPRSLRSHDPKLRQVRSGFYEGRNRWRLFNGLFDLSWGAFADITNYLQARDFKNVIARISQELVQAGGGDMLMDELRIIRGADPAKVMPWPAVRRR